MSHVDQSARHDFSRARLVLNAIIAVFAMLFTAVAFAMSLNFNLLILYLALSGIVTFLMYKIKALLASRVQEQVSSDEQVEYRSRATKWQSILILTAAMTIALILPLVLVVVLDPASWFVSFTSIVTGMGLSEILLYLFARKQITRHSENRQLEL